MNQRHQGNDMLTAARATQLDPGGPGAGLTHAGVSRKLSTGATQNETAPYDFPGCAGGVEPGVDGALVDRQIAGLPRQDTRSLEHAELLLPRSQAAGGGDRRRPRSWPAS